MIFTHTVLLASFHTKQCPGLSNTSSAGPQANISRKLLVNEVRFGWADWKPVSSGYKPYCTPPHVTPPHTNSRLYHLGKVEHDLRISVTRSIIACIGIFLPITNNWIWTVMNRHLLVLFITTEFIACTRDAGTLIYYIWSWK